LGRIPLGRIELGRERVVGEQVGMMQRFGRPLNAYIAGISVLAAATLVVAVWLTGIGDPTVATLCIVALTGAHLLPIPIRRGSEMETIGFEEAVVVPVLLALPAGGLIGGMFVSALLWQIVVRQPLQKAIFNAAQMLLSLAAAAGTVALLTGTAPGDTTIAPLAAIAGVVAMFVVNQLLIAGVFSLATGANYLAMLRDDIGMKASIWVVNTALGLLLIPAVFGRPSLLLAAVVLFGFMHAASRQFLRALQIDEAISELRDATATIEDDMPLPRIADHIARTACQIHGGCGAQVRLVPELRVDLPPDERHEGEELLFETGTRGRLVAVVKLESGGLRLGELRVWRAKGQVTPTLVQRRRDRAMLDLLARHAAVALARAAHQQDAARQRRKMAQVFEHASDGLMLLDDRGVVTAWNPAMARLSGFAESAIRSQPVTVASEDLGRIVREESAGVLDAELRTPFGERRIVRAAFAPIGNARTRNWVVAVHDSTREHEAERLKSDFVATVSHELRTPLTTIRGFLETMLRDDLQLDAAQGNEFLQIMRREAQRLDRLINDLLDSSAIAAGQAPSVRLQHVDVRELVDAAMLSFRRAHPETPVTLVDRGARNTLVRADPDRLQQVLLNLLENARRHGASDQPIELSVIGERFGRVGISVRDHGLGIGSAEQSRIFERFYFTRDSVTRAGGGAGLGLFICRRLMLAMDGAIEVQSEQGCGATFTIHVPAAVRRRETRRSIPAAAPAVYPAPTRSGLPSTIR
jgi:two-component system phosphate regulon sensor histidine kinase PhoR